MSGILYLCATPIGNLEDITARVLRILQEVDLIAAEDTRNSIKLLNHFNIKTPMTSYHEFNKYDKGRILVDKLIAGQNIALITDAGTPGISDPGEELVKMAYEAGVEVTSLPGACACVTALTLSGLSTGRFIFEGFLPTEKKDRAERLATLEQEQRTVILYEAPHRLIKTLKELYSALGNRNISICRELTKKHETVFRTDLDTAVRYYEEHEPKGECVLVLEGKDRLVILEENIRKWDDMSINEHMQLYLDKGLDKKEAMKAVAKDRGVSKRDIYDKLIT